MQIYGTNTILSDFHLYSEVQKDLQLHFFRGAQTGFVPLAVQTTTCLLQQLVKQK